MCFSWLTPPGPYRTSTCREIELAVDLVHTFFFTTQGHGGPPRMRNQPNSGATSETRRTQKTIHTIHAPIHSNRANMNRWLWRPNDIRGPCGPLSYRWGKTPKKPQPGYLSRPGIEPGPAAWQTRMLSPAPQRWTNSLDVTVFNGSLKVWIALETEEGKLYDEAIWW